VIAHDRLAQEVDPKVTCLMHQLIVELLLAMVVVRSRHWIITQQETTPSHTIHHMNNRYLIRSKHFCTG
jgi:hypothetical protein